MLPELTATTTAFATGARFLENLVGDFTAADWAVRDAQGHDPRWLVGHLAVYRKRVAVLMGLQQAEAPWEAAFVKGTSPADLPADLDMAGILASFRESSRLIAGGWEGLTRESLAKPIGRKMPNGREDVEGALMFLAWHEAYHMGQLGLLRRLTGRHGLA